ncbi:MAG: RNA-binding protein KhpA [Acidobacteriota bacterium]|nr:RNA-binding protein KhpA [Acidobacteriota bacterium]
MTTAADLLAVVRLLVDEPKAARVDVAAQGTDQLLEIRVPDADRGKVIGRRGRTIEALRALADIRGEREGQSYEVEVSDD